MLYYHEHYELLYSICNKACVKTGTECGEKTETCLLGTRESPDGEDEAEAAALRHAYGPGKRDVANLGSCLAD